MNKVNVEDAQIIMSLHDRLSYYKNVITNQHDTITKLNDAYTKVLTERDEIAAKWLKLTKEADEENEPVDRTNGE